MAILSERIPDKQLAKYVSDLEMKVREAAKAQSIDEFHPFRTQLAGVFIAANKRIGELLTALRPDHP